MCRQINPHVRALVFLATGTCEVYELEQGWGMERALLGCGRFWGAERRHLDVAPSGSWLLLSTAAVTSKVPTWALNEQPAFKATSRT